MGDTNYTPAETAIRDALIALGWTPPNTQATPPADAALELLATYLEQKGLDYAYGSYPQEMLNKAAAALRARQPAQAVAVPETDVVCAAMDSQYLAGLQAGWGLGCLNDREGYERAQSGRRNDRAKEKAALLAASKGGA